MVLMLHFLKLLLTGMLKVSGTTNWMNVKWCKWIPVPQRRCTHKAPKLAY